MFGFTAAFAVDEMKLWGRVEKKMEGSDSFQKQSQELSNRSPYFISFLLETTSSPVERRHTVCLSRHRNARSLSK